MNHVRLTQPGFEAFNGDFASQQFLNGVSVEKLPRTIADRIGALITSELIDDEGEAVGQAGTAARTVLATDVSAPLVTSLRRMNAEEAALEHQAAIRERETAPGAQIYSKEQLQTIADKEGITGLREVGVKWHVKDRSINKLIFEILRAQSAWVARSSEKAAEQLLAKEAARAEALKNEEAREALLSTTARNLSVEAEAKIAENIQKAAAEQVAREKAIADAAEAIKAKEIADAADLLAAAELAKQTPDETPNSVDEEGNSVYTAPAAEPEFEEPNNPSKED